MPIFSTTTYPYRVAGVDYDTNRVAICVLTGSSSRRDFATFRTVEYRGRKETAFQAARRIRVELIKTGALLGGPAVWWVEHAFGRGPVDFALGRVQGAILAALEYEDAVNEVGPSEWKKTCGLPGNAGKAVYQPSLRARLERFADLGNTAACSEHEIDAFGIALHGLIRYETDVLSGAYA